MWFTDFLAVSGLGSAWSIGGGGSFGMGAVVGGFASRDICLDQGAEWFGCPGICRGIAVSLSGGQHGLLFVGGWAEPESEPQLKVCCLYEVIHNFGTF